MIAPPPSPVHPPNTASAIIDGGGEQIISYWQRTTSRKSLFRDDTAGCGVSLGSKTAREEFVIWGITTGERWGRELYRFSERLSEKDSDKLRIGGLYYYAQLEGASKLSYGMSLGLHLTPTTISSRKICIFRMS